MHVALNATMVAPGMTGIGAYAAALLDLSAEALAPHRVTAFVQAALATGNRRVAVEPSSLWEQLTLPDWLHEHEVEVLHSPFFTCPTIANTPSILTVHDAIPWDRPDLCSEAFLAFFHGRIGAALRAAAWLVTTSKHARDRIAYHTGIPPTQIAVLEQSIGREFFVTAPGTDVPAPKVDAAKFGLDLPPRYILYVGMLEARKNIARLLAAYAIVAKQAPDVHLVLAGRRDSPAFNVEALIANHRLADRVHMPGYVSPEALPELYRRAAAFAFPSLYEGFGRPVAEAMAAGVPVVTSATTSLPEVVGDAAVLVDPESVEAIAEGVLAVLTDLDLQKSLRQRGFVRAQHFHPDTFAQRVRTFYDTVEATR